MLLEPNGNSHIMDSYGGRDSFQTIGALHAYKDDPASSSSIARTDGEAYVLTGAQLRSLTENGVVARQVIDGLISECRRHYPRRVTPLFQKQSPEQKLPVLAIGTAALVESYYRSG